MKHDSTINIIIFVKISPRVYYARKLEELGDFHETYLKLRAFRQGGRLSEEGNSPDIEMEARFCGDFCGRVEEKGFGCEVLGVVCKRAMNGLK